MQLLWLNLVTDVLPGIGLVLEPAEADVLQRPPHDPHDPMVRRTDFIDLAREAAVISTAALAAYGYGVMRYGISPRARSICFATLVGAQLLHALSCRSTSAGLFGPGHLRPNRHLTAALAASFAVQLAALFLPGLRRQLDIAPVGLTDAAVSIAAAGGAYLVNELAKRAPGEPVI
jgi:Ca2+-transporting ATPase